MLLNCGVEEESWKSFGLQEDSISPSQNKSVVNIHWKDWCWSWNSNTWPPDMKNWLIWKDPDAGRVWAWEEKGTTEDEMVGWHHWQNGHGFGWTLGVHDGEGGLACYSPWGHKELDMTERLNWTELNWWKSGSVFWGVSAIFSGSLCTQDFVCALKDSVSPVLWNFFNQIPLAFKVKFSGGSQSLCRIPRLGSLLWALEVLQHFDNFIGIIVLQFVGCLLGSSMAGLMVTSSKRTDAKCHTSQVCCSQSPCPCIRPLLTRASSGDTQAVKGQSGSVSYGVPGSWSTQSFVWALWAFLAGMQFDSKHNISPPAILLGLLLCRWMLGIFFVGILHSSVVCCSVVSCNFQVLTRDDEHMFSTAPSCVSLQ